jgi:hypothetical protein
MKALLCRKNLPEKRQKYGHLSKRHCEERSDAAIRFPATPNLPNLDCRVGPWPPRNDGCPYALHVIASEAIHAFALGSGANQFLRGVSEERRIIKKTTLLRPSA